jgi:general secretion pathway protein G
MKATKLARVAIILFVAAVLTAAIESEKSARNRADYSKARAQIAVLQEALRRYWIDNGSYPTTDAGLSALGGYYSDRRGEAETWELDPDIAFPRRHSVRPHPTDPWGNPYFYQSDGQTYVLKSLGPNGSQTEDENKNLIAHSPEPPSN